MVIYDKDKGKLFIPENDDNSMYGYKDVYNEGFADGYADGYEEAAEECGEAKDYASKYFTIEVKEGGNLEIPEKVSHYRLNDGEWVENNHANIFTRPGDRIEMKGINDDCKSLFWNTEQPNSFFVYGNIMSLIYGDEFSDKYTFENEMVFSFMFEESEGIVDASDLILPATDLTYRCYCGMFQECPNLIAGPKLPATNLADSCYATMYSGCTSFCVAPELPADELTYECYLQMFYGCTSLTTAPELPATILAPSCYLMMFYGCTSLTKAPELPATTLVPSCYGWMFHDCTSLTTAPELPVATLEYSCYYRMFYGCSSLNYVKCLATDISVDKCTENWLSGVAEEGTFVKAEEMEDWDEGASGIPNNWTIIDE